MRKQIFVLCVKARCYFVNTSDLAEIFLSSGLQMRKYQACVVYMPILLRICRSESAHEIKISAKSRKIKKRQEPLDSNHGKLTVEKPPLLMLQ